MNKEIDLSFDCIYVLNLEHRHDRLNTFFKSAAKEGIRKDSLHVFKAINGNKIKMPNNWVFTSGELGCLESHLAVLEDAQQKKYKSILVLEDDIKFCNRFKYKLKNALSELHQNWDMLYLYSYHHLQPQAYSKKLNKCKATLSTVAYAVNSTSIPFLIQKLKYRNQVVDVILAAQHEKINAFAVKKNLCIHYDGYSDVKQKDIKYDLSFYDKVRFRLKHLFNKIQF